MPRGIDRPITVKESKMEGVNDSCSGLGGAIKERNADEECMEAKRVFGMPETELTESDQRVER